MHDLLLNENEHEMKSIELEEKLHGIVLSNELFKNILDHDHGQGIQEIISENNSHEKKVSPYLILAALSIHSVFTI